jgi:hypothetical protein
MKGCFEKGAPYDFAWRFGTRSISLFRPATLAINHMQGRATRLSLLGRSLVFEVARGGPVGSTTCEIRLGCRFSAYCLPSTATVLRGRNPVTHLRTKDLLQMPACAWNLEENTPSWNAA